MPVDDLLDYLDPKDQSVDSTICLHLLNFVFNCRTFAVGQSVLCQHGAEGLWKPGTIETVEPDNDLCVVRFTHFNGLEAIPFGSIRITSEFSPFAGHRSTPLVVDQPELIENIVDDVPVTLEFLPSVNFDSSQSDEFGQWERHTRVSRSVGDVRQS